MVRSLPLTLVLAALACSATAAGYPSHPIRIVVPYTAGSASDIITRLVAPKLAETWKQQVVIDNRPGAGGSVGGAIVASASPDGHTLMFTTSQFANSAALYDKLPYDSLRDFVGITELAVTPLVLVVSPNLGIKSAKDLIAMAKQKPGEINFASSGIASGPHYATELLKLKAGINVVHVPYRGSPEAINDTMSGRVHFFLSPVLTAMPVIKSGRINALAVTTPQRLPMLPDVPTFAEAALPGFVYEGWYGAFAPAKTPRAIVAKIAKEVGRALMLPDVYEKIASTGALAKPSTPEEFDRMVREEIALRGKILKAAGAKAE